MLDESGLHEISRITNTFDAPPWNILCDNHRRAVFVDVHKESRSVVKICRWEGAAWSVSDLPVRGVEKIWIVCWTGIDNNKLAIFDWSSQQVMIMEYM